MAFREIRKVQQQQESRRMDTLFEEAEEMAHLVKKPAPKVIVTRDPAYVPKPMKVIDHSSPDAKDLESFEYVPPKKKFKLSLPKWDDSRAFQIIKLGIKVLIGCALIYFGLTQTGSFFGPASGKFAGDLAMIFYRYQLGQLIAMFGVIIIYDAYIFR